jgi:hypothetical protein
LANAVLIARRIVEVVVVKRRRENEMRWDGMDWVRS